ncbi:hypothetical protein H4R99_007992, partial [Coemansia sp. RSA 1722]
GKGASSWLPELDSPKLSIALPPVDRDPEPPQAVVNEITQSSKAADTKAVAVAPASEAPAASQDATSPSSASSVAGADYYYQLDTIKSESSVASENLYENPTEELHGESPKALSLAETHVPLAPAPRSDVDMQTMLDHLGLDFDFASDPAIDDINATPLFAMPPSVAECAQPECESQHDLDLASQQPHQTRPALTDAPSSSGAKARVRRSSIASMLIRRTSKCFDSIGSGTASDSPVAKEQKPETLSQVQVQPEPQAQAQVQAEDKTQVEDQPLPQSSGTDAVSGSASPKEPAQPSDEASAAASQEQAPVESSDTSPPYAHSNVDPAAVPAASPAPVADAASVFVAKALVEQTAASADPSAAEASSESFNASSAAESAEKSDSTASGSLQPSGDSPAASLSYEADKSTAAVTEPPSTQSIPARRPPMARNLDRRSSRFLDEITRKVQHVRQTTSMVLRRSVGSRLSVIPVAPSENMAAASTEDPSQHQLQSDSLPEQEQEQGQALQQVQRCDTAHASDKQVCVPDDAADQSDAAEDIQDADDHDSDNDNAKPVVAATAEGSAHQRGGLARRFTFVRRGTNEAVRNSVSRVKGIFASKKSVAA